MTIDKNALKKVMISNYENILAELREDLATKKGSSDLDENDTLDPEDYSTQTVSNVMVDLLKEQIVKTEKDLERTYIHPEYNREFKLSELLALYAWHGKHHYGHLQIILKNK